MTLHKKSPFETNAPRRSNMNTEESFKLILGDCLEQLKPMTANSVDAVITDPPYGTTECAWDKVVPLKELFAELKRVTKPTGAIVVFGSEPFSTELRMSAFDMYKYDWIWVKSRPTGHVHAKNKPMKKHEIISVFSRGVTTHEGQSTKRMSYFPQGLVRLEKPIQHKARHSDVVMGKRPSHRDFVQEFTGYPSSVLEFPCVTRGQHPTQKPVELMEYLSATYCPPGGVILDPFMGSGSTGVAAAKLGFRFIGIEMNEEYLSIAQKRIEHVGKEPA